MLPDLLLSAFEAPELTFLDLALGVWKLVMLGLNHFILGTDFKKNQMNSGRVVQWVGTVVQKYNTIKRRKYFGVS